MIGACPDVATGGLATGVLASADCLIGDQVEQGYAMLLAPGGSLATALTIALTIYVAVFGYRLALGLSSLTLGEVVPHFIKIGVIFALATSWPSYQALVFETLFHGPEQVANVIVRAAAGPGVTSGDVLGTLQAVFDRLIDAASDAWAQTPPAAAAVAAPAAPAAPATPGLASTIAAASAAAPQLALGAPQFLAGLLWLAALIMLGASVGVLLVVRIVLALLLLLGPVFVAFALFRATRGIAEGWLRVTIKFALVPLFTLPLIAGLVAVLGPLVAELDGAPVTSVRDSPVLLILLVVVVFAAVMTQAARLGGGIAGSIRLPRGATAPQPADTVTNAGSSNVAINNAAASSRAETIVQAITAGNRDADPARLGSTAAGLTATRTITARTDTPPAVTDNSGRLGQGYRRLSVASPAPTARRS